MVGLVCRKQNPSSREKRTQAVTLFMHLPHSCKTNENSDFLCFDIEDCNNVIICISTFVCIIHILTVNFNAKLSLILKKNCQDFPNNKGADKPVHPRSLISVFDIRLPVRIISGLATSKSKIF